MLGRSKEEQLLSGSFFPPPKTLLQRLCIGPDLRFLRLTLSFLPSLFSWIPLQNTLCQVTISPATIRYSKIEGLPPRATKHVLPKLCAQDGTSSPPLCIGALTVRRNQVPLVDILWVSWVPVRGTHREEEARSFKAATDLYPLL